MEVLII
jgi:hypothetical protein